MCPNLGHIAKSLDQAGVNIMNESKYWMKDYRLDDGRLIILTQHVLMLCDIKTGIVRDLAQEVIELPAETTYDPEVH